MSNVRNPVEGMAAVTPTVRKPLDGFAVTLMVTLCLIWGLQQVAIKVAAPSVAPVMQIAIRSGIAAVMVALFMLARNIPIFNRDRTLWPGLAAGALFALEFMLIALGLGYTTASHMSVFLYTQPIFTTLGLHIFVPGERMGRLQWVGVFVAFLGVVVAFSHGFIVAEGEYPYMWVGDILGTVAGFLWGMTTVVIRSTTLSEIEPTKTLLYQLVVASVGIFALAWYMGVATIHSMTALAWASMTYQVLVVGFFSLMAWFWLLRRYLASRMSVFTFLTPVFGVFFGVWLLDEPLTLAFIVGSLLILIGIVLVNLPRRR